jgi:hypothetical protein
MCLELSFRTDFINQASSVLQRTMKLVSGDGDAIVEAQLMSCEKIDAAFEAAASLMAGASADEIVHRYRQHIAVNAIRLAPLSSATNTMFGWFVAIVMFAVVTSSDALSQQSFQELESTNQFERALAAVDAIKNRKRLQCVLAIANRALCECLSRNLPVDTYFRSYASIANQEKEAPEYGRLSAADKKIVDQCVNGSR